MSGPTARVLAFHTGTLAGAASTEASAPLALGAPVVIPPQPHGRRLSTGTYWLVVNKANADGCPGRGTSGDMALRVARQLP